MLELTLLRHSIAVGNERRCFLGVTDSPLSEAGLALARRRAAAVTREPLVYVSPLERARTTADIVWPGAEKVVVTGLREMDFGVFENRTNEEMRDDPVYAAWLAQGKWTDYPGGESFSAARERILSAFASSALDAMARGLPTAGMVAHGGTVMFIMEHFSDAQADFYSHLVKNCGGYRLRLRADDGALTLEGYEPLAELEG